MPVEIWSVLKFKTKLNEHADKEFDVDQPLARQQWVDSALELGRKAAARGDGLAIYVNVDLGHRDIGQWQIASYGSSESQLETRHQPKTPEALRVVEALAFQHGQDVLPTTLPDIGGRINWRYSLEAIVPSYTQHETAGTKDEDWEAALAKGVEAGIIGIPCSVQGCVYREGHDLDTFPHRVEGDTPHDRLVVVQVKVSGGPTEEEARTIVSRVVEVGLANWHDSTGEIGFTAEETLGQDAFDKGVDLHFVDAVVI